MNTTDTLKRRANELLALAEFVERIHGEWLEDPGHLAAIIEDFVNRVGRMDDRGVFMLMCGTTAEDIGEDT